MNRVFLNIGSNHDAFSNLCKAVIKLNRKIHVSAVSRVYESPDINRSRLGPAYLNICVEIQTPLDALALKGSVLKVIENQMGRHTGVIDSIPIDIDMILFNDENIQVGKRMLPDKGIALYPHIAVPLADIAPDYVHQPSGEKISAIVARLTPEHTIHLRTDLDMHQCLHS